MIGWILGCLPDRRDILNFRMDKGLRLDRPGDMFRGVLFACGTKQVPNTYRTETRAPVTLRFYDQMDLDYPEQAHLVVERMTWPRIRCESTGNNRGLFELMEVAETHDHGTGQEANAVPTRVERGEG